MADQAITALPKKTYSGSSQIASTDYLLGIDSAEGYQMLIQDLGEYIINRATASLAGSTQTLASAISALNSKQTKYTITYGSTASVSGSTYTYPSISQAIDAIVSANGNRAGRYMAECINSTSYSDTYSSIISANSTLVIDVIGSSYINVIAITLTNPTACPFIKRSKGTGNVWTDWVGLPSRAEIDTMNLNHTSSADNVTGAIRGWIDAAVAKGKTGFYSGNMTWSGHFSGLVIANVHVVSPARVTFLCVPQVGNYAGKHLTATLDGNSFQVYEFEGSRIL